MSTAFPQVIHVRIRHSSRADGDLTPDQWHTYLTDSATWKAADTLKIEPVRLSRKTRPSAAMYAWVRRCTLASGQQVVIKCQPLITHRSDLQSILGFGRADRHLLAAARLAAAGISTPRVLCVARAMLSDEKTRIPCELLIMQALEGPTLLECITMTLESSGANRLPVRAQHQLAKATAALVANLDRAGLYNRDHKPSNIIIAAPDSMNPQLALIDCVGIRRIWLSPGSIHLHRMLAKLVIEPLGCSVPIRRSLLMCALKALWENSSHSASAWRAFRNKTWAAVAAIIAAHGDPCPAINPIDNLTSPQRQPKRSVTITPS